VLGHFLLDLTLIHVSSAEPMKSDVETSNKTQIFMEFSLWELDKAFTTLISKKIYKN